MLAAVIAIPELRAPVSSLVLLSDAAVVSAGILEAYRSRRALVAILYPLLLVLTHITYALAFLRGLLSPSLKRYTRQARQETGFRKRLLTPFLTHASCAPRRFDRPIPKSRL